LVCQGSPITSRRNADGHSICIGWEWKWKMNGAHCYIGITLLLWCYEKGCLFYMDLLLLLKIIKTLCLEYLQYQSKVWTHLLFQGFFFIFTIFYISCFEHAFILQPFPALWEALLSTNH
jgi:hypothetical protein